MSIQPVRLVYLDAGSDFDDEYSYGIGLICTTSNRPLNVSRLAFSDLDEAEEFLRWLTVDARTLSPAQLDDAIQKWRGVCAAERGGR